MLVEIDDFDLFVSVKRLDKVKGIYRPRTKQKYKGRFKWVRVYFVLPPFKPQEKLFVPNLLSILFKLPVEALATRIEGFALRARGRVGVRTKDSVILTREAFNKVAEMLIREASQRKGL